MFALQRVRAVSAAMQKLPRLVFPSHHRCFANGKSNEIEGRDRFNVLGPMARWSPVSSVMGSYPPFRVSCSLNNFRKKWEYLQKGERVPETELSVAGRIETIG